MRILLWLASKGVKLAINADLKAMYRCEKTLDLSQVEDIEHAEFHSRHRQELGARLAKWEDLRDRYIKRREKAA